jgi:hypothetical protein
VAVLKTDDGYFWKQKLRAALRTVSLAGTLAVSCPLSPISAQVPEHLVTTEIIDG